MARTPSNMLALDTKLEDFTLLNTVNNRTHSLFSIKEDKPTVVMFICNHCPFVVHLHEGLKGFYKDYKSDVNLIAISSNDIGNYPDDKPELMTKLFEKLGFDFPYFFDKSQEVAKKFEAACTPDFYLFDKKEELVYRGQFDSSRPGNDINVSGEDLRNAVENTFVGHVIADENQLPSVGCNIKWK